MPAKLSASLVVVLCLFEMACNSDEPAAQAGSDAGLADGASASDGAADDSGPGPDGGPGADGSLDGDGGPALDGGMLPDVCNPVLQSGCSAPTTKCVVENPEPNGGTTCVAPGTDVGLGERCTGQDCLAGLACVATSSTTASCVQVCDFRDGTGCESFGSDYDCRRRIVGTVWGACTELSAVCQPATQAPCEADEACQPYLRRNGTWELRCRAAGSTPEGGACGSSAGGAACQRGQVCVQDGANHSAVCRRYCETNADCTAPETCIGHVSEPSFKFCAM